MAGISTMDYEKLQGYVSNNHNLPNYYSYRSYSVNGDSVTQNWYGHNNDGPKYLVVGDQKALTLALLCQLVPSGKEEPPWQAVIIPPSWLAGSYPTIDKLVAKWIRNGNCKLDVRSPECPISMREEDPLNTRAYYRKSWFSYTGEVPKRIAMSYAKTVFNETVAKYWSGDFIVGNEHRMSKKLTGLARAKVLAKAIMLGEKEVDIPLGGRTGTKFTGLKADTLMSTTFDISKMPEEARNIVKSVQVFRDYAELWSQAIEDNRFFAMRVDEKDLEERPEEVLDAFRRGAEFISLENYLEPYREGVPIEDIVCKQL